MPEITFTVRSLSALLMNSPAAMVRSTGAMGTKTVPTPEDEAESKAYRLPSGQLYLPSIHFRSSVLNAVKGLRIGKAGARQVFAASLFVLDEFCPLHHPETLGPLSTYEVDVQRCVVQGSGILRARPKLPQWGTRILFEYDDQFLAPELIVDAFTRAGKIAGVGDYRPASPKGAGGPYGRFTVERV